MPAVFSSIPAEIFLGALPALLLEVALYLAMTSPAIRARLARLTPWQIALVLLASSWAPWLLYAPRSSPLMLLALTLPLAFWYIFLPRHPLTDALLFLLLPAVILAKGRLFRDIYPDPMPGLRLDVLGQLMWIRLSLGVMLLLRRGEKTGFGLVPTKTEWAIGARYFLQALPAGLAAGFALGFLKFGLPKVAVWLLPLYAIGIFIGIFAVVALSEEFFLRGLLLGSLERWWGNRRGALAVVSLLSGAVHLGFRGFPNWKFALVSAVLHWFFGRAYQESGGIRAGMVAHALTVTVWMLLFAKSG